MEDGLRRYVPIMKTAKINTLQKSNILGFISKIFMVHDTVFDTGGCIEV